MSYYYEESTIKCDIETPKPAIKSSKSDSALWQDKKTGVVGLAG